MPRKTITREQVIAGYAMANTAAGAGIALGFSPATFKRYAKEFGLYKTNQGGKGLKKTYPTRRISTSDYLKKGTFINSSKLKNRILSEGHKKNACEECESLPFWKGKPLVLHLDHIDGDSTNNELDNLRMLCPNCHSQTSTYCRGQGKNKARVAKLVDATRLGRVVT